MICAYDKIYLNSVQKMMGCMLQYAVYDCGLQLGDFYKHFLESSNSTRIAKGDVLVLTGKSGVELTLEALGICDEEDIYPQNYIGRSKEYWTGWALAYYQWMSGKSFYEIQQEIPIEKIMDLYNPYHEMDILQFVDKMNELSQKVRMVTYLKKFRELSGISQSELSRRTGIPVKTIQKYEQGRKDIRKAQAEYVIKLAKALYCKPEQLLL